nr:MAG TPA: hypothetical protein [Bacteriophage sp.]
MSFIFFPLIVLFSSFETLSIIVYSVSIISLLSKNIIHSIPLNNNNFELSFIQTWYIVGGVLSPLHIFTYLLLIIF